MYDRSNFGRSPATRKRYLLQRPIWQPINYDLPPSRRRTKNRRRYYYLCFCFLLTLRFCYYFPNRNTRIKDNIVSVSLLNERPEQGVSFVIVYTLDLRVFFLPFCYPDGWVQRAIVLTTRESYNVSLTHSSVRIKMWKRLHISQLKKKKTDWTKFEK